MTIARAAAIERDLMRKNWVEQLVGPLTSATLHDATLVMCSHEQKWDLARLHGRAAVGWAANAQINALALGEQGKHWKDAAAAIVAFCEAFGAQLEDHLKQVMRHRRIDAYVSPKIDRVDRLDNAAFAAVVDRYALLGGKASDLLRVADACEKIANGETPQEVFAKAAAGK